MKKQERIESAQKRIQELKKLIYHWLKNEKTKLASKKTRAYRTRKDR